jgi:RHS repeat-associated protein
LIRRARTTGCNEGKKNGSATLGNLTYTYDLAGRRTVVGGTFGKTSVPTAVASTGYNANNQLTQFGTSNLTYDANGNLTSDGANTYTWDARNHLVSISGKISASFQYDPFGRRVSKTIGATTSFLYDGMNPVQELFGTTVAANMLTGEVDEYFTRADAAGTRSFLSDAVGSTIALADVSGTLQTTYTYDPFGNTAVNGATTTNSFAFTGRELDAANLYYYRARYYNPSLQRFISEDPVRLRGGPNFYSYVWNNPPNGKDPFGLFTLNLGGTINFQWGPINLQYNGGVVIESDASIGVYNTGGVGAGVGVGAGAFFGLTGGISTAHSVCGFAGPFYETGESAGLGVAESASVYSGYDEDQKTIVGGGSVTAGIGGGAQVYLGGTVTSVTPLIGRKSCQ